jgi:hypothetical protein
MATRKTKSKLGEDTIEWPKITTGSHSTRYEYEDGRVEFNSDWELLSRDVREAIAEYEKSLNEVKPEGETNGKIKKTRKSK